MTGRLLVVDPEGERSETAAEVDGELEDASVTTASSVADALATLTVGAADCVVTDHRPPEVDAVELLEAIDEFDPSIPVILYPRDGSETLAAAAIRAGVTDYVPRSDGIEALVERVAPLRDASGTFDCCQVVESVADVVTVWEPDRPSAELDAELCDALGCRYDDCSLMTVETVRADGVAVSNTAELVYRAVELGTISGEWCCETADGEQTTLALHLESVPHFEGRRIVVVGRNVTEQARRERRLRSFREAVDQAGHSMYVTSPDGTIQYVNPAFERTTGFDADEAVGENPRILKSGVHDKAFYADLWGTILSGKVWSGQLVNRRRNGERYVINQTIAPIESAEGEIEQFVAVNADVTAQKHRERQLRELHRAVREWLSADSREAAATLACRHVENVLGLELIGVSLYNESTDALEHAGWSQASAALFEEPPTFERGSSVAWRVYDSGDAEFYDDVQQVPHVYNPETPVRSEIVLPLGDHGVLLVASTSTSAFDEWDRTIAKVVAANLEATFDRIARERTLAAKNERLEGFARVISHDLRNPLGVASGTVDQVKATGDLDPLDRVETAHDRIATIIDELLILAREGAAVGSPAPVSVESVVEAAWRVVDTRDATLAFEGDDEWRMMADENRLRQLLENLFRNALEHGTAGGDASSEGEDASFGGEDTSSEGEDASFGGEDTSSGDEDASSGDLIVRVGPLHRNPLTDDADGGRPVGFYVEDTGPGIPADDRDRVLETGYTTSADGTGLGLSIVSTVVEAHGWHLELGESEEGGARFEIITRS